VVIFLATSELSHFIFSLVHGRHNSGLTAAALMVLK